MEPNEQENTAKAAPLAIRREMILRFGEAYKAFGFNKVMGYIVALLLASKKELSLDEITDLLGMSKGPVSQLARRLCDHNLIKKVWVPGSRKDFYTIEDDIFAQAFNNNVSLIRGNRKLAEDLLEQIDKAPDAPEYLAQRVKEMHAFYSLMEKHFINFLDEWGEVRRQMQEQEAGEVVHT